MYTHPLFYTLVALKRGCKQKKALMKIIILVRDKGLT